jgi:hypothetical protein
MRDIRSDLRERLTKLAAQMARLQEELDELSDVEDGIKMLLRQEEAQFANESAPLFPESNDVGSGLAQLIIHTMREKNRPVDLDELKDVITKTQYDFGEKNPGRVIHFALVGMNHGGLVERLNDKRWMIKPNNGIPVQETMQ